MRRRKKRKVAGEVELNLAAMLDMAFQLLTFFILTFKPAPVEGEVSLRLPPPQPVTQMKNAQQAGSDTQNTNPVEGLNTLVISVLPDKGGEIGSLAIGEGAVGNLQQLKQRLATVLTDQASPFDQVILQVGSGLRYDALMRVVDVCTQQKLPSGKKLTKLSFVELPDTPAG